MEDTNEYLFKFKQHLAVLNRSPATIEAYTDHTRAFLKSADDIKQITRRHIEDYIANLYDYKTIAGKPYKIGTICVKVRSVNAFLSFWKKQTSSLSILPNVSRNLKRKRAASRPRLPEKRQIKSWTSRTWEPCPAFVTVQSWKSFIPPVSG